MSNNVQQVNNQVQEANPSYAPPDVIESLVLNGDLSKMNSEQRVTFYNGLCKSLGLNPLTQPFEIINLKGKLKMYAKKDATDQLRKIYSVSVTELTTQQVGDIYMVTAKGQDGDGRIDSAIGAVSLTGQHGEGLANAIMKAESKAKRRLTLSLCGLGMLDELEVESIKTAETAQPQQDYTNIDVVDPSDLEAVNKLNEMLEAIMNPIVPIELFGGQSKENFISDFRTKLNTGTLSVEFAHNVYNAVLAEFNKQ